MKKVIVHKFTVADVYDLEIYSKGVLYEFEQSEKGKWVKDNTTRIVTEKTFNPSVGAYTVCVRAEFNEQDAMFFLLKWGNS